MRALHQGSTPFFNELTACSQFLRGYRAKAPWLRHLRANGAYHFLLLSALSQFDRPSMASSTCRTAFRAQPAVPICQLPRPPGSRALSCCSRRLWRRSCGRQDWPAVSTDPTRFAHAEGSAGRTPPVAHPGHSSSAPTTPESRPRRATHRTSFSSAANRASRVRCPPSSGGAAVKALVNVARLKPFHGRPAHFKSSEPVVNRQPPIRPPVKTTTSSNESWTTANAVESAST